MMSGAETDLRAGLQGLGLALSDVQISQLLAFQDLISKWTKVYNLTAVRDPREMLTHHLLDSLAIINPLRLHLASTELAMGCRLLDVGSGAGLPGVVIAICCPTIAVTCVDTVAKKAAFIKQVALALKLPHLTGLHARVETITQPFDVICARAFASLGDFTSWSVNALAPEGVWLAMKGRHPADEIAALDASVSLFHVEPLQVPGLDAERCLLWLRSNKPLCNSKAV